MDESQPLLKESKNENLSSDSEASFGENNSRKLTKLEKFSYGLGHIYNDLCAAMWFSYTLLFLQAVLELESTNAGFMMLLGQVMDALATPVIGYLADRRSSKRVWHLIGSTMVLFSFPLIFSRCLGCGIESGTTWWRAFYYASVITIFQCGWAIVQISHLAMIPILTEDNNERAELTAIRYTASVCSGVTVYLTTWTILHIEGGNTETGVRPSDDYKFRNVSLVLTAIGCVSSVLFHLGLRRQTDTGNESKRSRSDFNDDATERNAKSLLSSPSLYRAALLYVAARLFNALAQVYMPLYLDERLTFPDAAETVEVIASVPLASYVASFFTSVLLKFGMENFNNKLLYVVGSIVGVGGCAWTAISLSPNSGPTRLYAVAALFGVGGSMTTIASLCVAADVVGARSNRGAAVYSAVTFADKLIAGVAVVVVEDLSVSAKSESERSEYYRGILAYVCGGSAAFGAATVVLFHLFRCDRREAIN